MNPNTGQIYDLPEGVSAKEKSRELGVPLVKIPDKDLDKVRKMSDDDRKAYIKRVQKNRAKAKARRKANRKRRVRK